MKDLEIQELPPLVYQLLLLSTKVFELCICFNLVKCRKRDFHVYIFYLIHRIDRKRPLS